MANTTLTQTGAQVQAILDKADKLPSTLGTAGQVLTMNAGATAPEWQTPSGGGYTLTVTYAGEEYWVFFADGTYQHYSSGTTGAYNNAIAIGITNDAMMGTETGYGFYLNSTSTIPLSAFIGNKPASVTRLRILLSDKTCRVDAD